MRLYKVAIKVNRLASGLTGRHSLLGKVKRLLVTNLLFYFQGNFKPFHNGGT
jgi:hypothetical protein